MKKSNKEVKEKIKEIFKRKDGSFDGAFPASIYPLQYNELIAEILKEVIPSVRKEVIESIRENIVKLAIRGKDDRDEMKGAMLFSRIMEYLNNL